MHSAIRKTICLILFRAGKQKSKVPGNKGTTWQLGFLSLFLFIILFCIEYKWRTTVKHSTLIFVFQLAETCSIWWHIWVLCLTAIFHLCSVWVFLGGACYLVFSVWLMPSVWSCQLDVWKICGLPGWGKYGCLLWGSYGRYRIHHVGQMQSFLRLLLVIHIVAVGFKMLVWLWMYSLLSIRSYILE